MNQKINITDKIIVGAQPTKGELHRMRQNGFKSVVNLRTEGEEDQPLSPEEEGKLVKKEGMKYFHLPVAMQEMNEEKVDLFREQFRKLPQPVFVHCKSGMRSGALTIMHLAVEQGKSGEEAIQEALYMGFECDKPEIKEFVQDYIDRHKKAVV